MQDGAGIHRANIIKNWLIENEIECNHRAVGRAMYRWFNERAFDYMSRRIIQIVYGLL